MNIDELYLITFSPTGTSRKIGESIARATGIASLKAIDLTLKQPDLSPISSNALVVITVPVYAGHVPPVVLGRMSDLRSEGAPAVLVAVYGNRAYENALRDLETFVVGRGFKVIGGATFIGEHSYSTSSYPIAAGRPDTEDLEYARNFGKSIMKKLDAAPDLRHLSAVSMKRIRKPKQPLLPLLRFIRGVIKVRKNTEGMPRTPIKDIDRCNNCGYCAAICPTAAIVIENGYIADSDKCIKCCACVKGCPRQARVFDTPFGILLSKCFRYRKQPQTIF